MATPWLTGLNPDQKRAVTSRARRLLVTAGAGSGKTFVIIRRIGYLIQNCGVEPERILAITFTRNAAGEMAQRLRQALQAGGEVPGEPKISRTKPGANAESYLSRFNVRTFHSLCYLIMRRHWRLLFDRPFRLVTDRVPGEPESRIQGRHTKNEMLKGAIKHCLSETDFRLEFKRYLRDYLIETDETDRFGGLDDPRAPRLATATGIKVRSSAEREIADWLHQRGIAFHYDRPVSWSKTCFRPDFYLPGQDAYIEVWDYRNPGSQTRRREKLRRYLAHDKRLIEVERDELLDFSALEKRFRSLLPEAFGRSRDTQRNGLHQDQELIESLEAGYPEALNSFLSLAEEVLDKVKNHTVDPSLLGERAERDGDRRTRSFYRLFLRIYESYRDLLKAEGALDFNDLILQSIELLRRNPSLRRRYRRQWSHVLVDEYQDVNTPQVLLLKELIGPETHLTCVGDDWQSIYGFRGANVGHIQNFSAEFPGTRTVNLRLNYRSGASIVGFSGHAIRKCKKFTDKQLVALHRDLQRIVLHEARFLYDDGVGYVAARIRDLLEEGTYRPQDILILYRRSSSYRLLGEALRHQGIKARHETIHGAKGLEAPCVFLWGLVGGRGGFPRIWPDSSILRLVLPQDLYLRMDEERRVFYVALTRARERLFLITEKNNTSEFLKGAPAQYFQHHEEFSHPERPAAAPAYCPQCGETLLPQWRFCPFCYHGLETFTRKLTREPKTGKIKPDS